ncbi:helix-turn-helix domain-containing protein [Streptomyces candidus]|uniref:Transcriptional regulator with XRE-family HTH domain n=1 Tax=Streptomyces candidus TaxID=67283 RepID=A0A7X0LS89_9ACTN|nr:XRE family transcriptional regulator [Streptomyces candidus]MBB6437746.1 transcriptional regulator with XRE-family HTH domain [Streptomyces candidus]GHH50367.1 transcriptional regulator [Streptomyces candidus]
MSDLDQLTQSLARNLKRWRSERGFTLDALAARAGVSRGMIIQVEQARTNPSVGTTVKLADALGISIATFLDQEQGARVRLVTPAQTVTMWSTPAGSRATLLVGTQSRGPLELWSWLLMPGDASTSDPHPTGTTELLHVTAGELTLVVDGTSHPMPAGTSATFEADVPHAYRNDGPEPVEMTVATAIPPAR